MTDALVQLNKEKTLFWSLVGTLLLCAGFYMFFITATVHNVVARQNLESEISRLTLSIGTREFQYITMRNNVTLPLAYSLGFEDAGATTFISKQVAQVSFLSR